MAQNKIVNISLLVAVFAVSAVAGYFLQGVVMPEKETVIVGDGPDTDPLPEVDSTLYQKDTVAVDTVAVEEVIEEVVEEVKPEPYAKYSESEMQALMNSGDYDGYCPPNSKAIFSTKMQIEVLNLRSDDSRPSDVATVCRKVLMGTWTGVTVVDIRYTEMNVITKVTLNAHYPLNEQANE